jgi:transposase
MKAYSLDLRQRIFSYSLTHPVPETAHIFQVSSSTVQELKHLFFRNRVVIN